MLVCHMRSVSQWAPYRGEAQLFCFSEERGHFATEPNGPKALKTTTNSSRRRSSRKRKQQSYEGFFDKVKRRRKLPSDDDANRKEKDMVSAVRSSRKVRWDSGDGAWFSQYVRKTSLFLVTMIPISSSIRPTEKRTITTPCQTMYRRTTRQQHPRIRMQLYRLIRISGHLLIPMPVYLRPLNMQGIRLMAVRECREHTWTKNTICFGTWRIFNTSTLSTCAHTTNLIRNPYFATCVHRLSNDGSCTPRNSSRIIPIPLYATTITATTTTPPALLITGTPPFTLIDPSWIC